MAAPRPNRNDDSRTRVVSEIARRIAVRCFSPTDAWNATTSAPAVFAACGRIDRKADVGPDPCAEAELQTIELFVGASRDLGLRVQGKPGEGDAHAAVPLRVADGVRRQQSHHPDDHEAVGRTHGRRMRQRAGECGEPLQQRGYLGVGKPSRSDVGEVLVVQQGLARGRARNRARSVAKSCCRPWSKRASRALRRNATASRSAARIRIMRTQRGRILCRRHQAALQVRNRVHRAISPSLEQYGCGMKCGQRMARTSDECCIRRWDA